MSNDVWTNIRISGPSDEVARFMEAVRSRERLLDFDCIVPMPPELLMDARPQDAEFAASLNDAERLTRALGCHLFLKDLFKAAGSPDTPDAFRTLAAQRVVVPGVDFAQLWELGIVARENKRRHGHCCWHPWRKEHWGTPYNATDVSACIIDATASVFRFRTVERIPRPILFAIDEQFPTLSMTGTTMEELGHWGAEIDGPVLTFGPPPRERWEQEVAISAADTSREE